MDKNFASIWILIDPYQDYEESITILGAYPSAEAAMASPLVADDTQRWTGTEYVPAPRAREAQHWVGEKMVGLWRLVPPSTEWVWDTRTW